jgi:3-oxoacyl-[acyl-carrier-protein] synthase I
MSGPVFARIGLCTPLGLTAQATQHAIAAGIACFRDTTVIGRHGEPIRAASLTALEPTSTRSERILFFAARALRECLDGVLPGAFASIPAFIALPEPGRGAPLAPLDVRRTIARAAPPGLPLDWSAPPIAAGRAGFFQALDAARTAIAQRSAEAVLVAGVDSYCDPVSLEQLDDRLRILGEDNPDGLIPGEGAGVVLLASGSAARRAGLAALGTLETSALGRDAEPFEERTGAHARGLTAVLRQLRSTSAVRVDAVLSCQTSEGLWARELSIAHMRNAAVMPEPQRRVMLAASLGDTGAAAGPIQIGMLLHLHPRSWRKKRPLERAILYGAADGGDVGACIVAASPSSPVQKPLVP